MNHVLNDRIAALIGWRPQTIDRDMTGKPWPDERPDFSGDIAAAWQVINWLRAKGKVVQVLCLPHCTLCSVYESHSDWDRDNYLVCRAADTAPEAICFAAMEMMKERGQ